jgi:hypothetical protein
MPTYKPVHEDEILVHVTEGGLIAFKSHDRRTERVVDIYFSIRQARLLLEDLPRLLEEAEDQAVYFGQWQNGGDDAESSNS